MVLPGSSRLLETNLKGNKYYLLPGKYRFGHRISLRRLFRHQHLSRKFLVCAAGPADNLRVAASSAAVAIGAVAAGGTTQAVY